MKVLNDHIIGNDRRYLVGNSLTIADYFGVCLLTLGEITRCDWSKYPNVKRWVDTMKQLKSWNKVNEVLYGYAGQVKDQQFVTV
jgi:glutathione S-transferase